MKPLPRKRIELPYQRRQRLSSLCGYPGLERWDGSFEPMPLQKYLAQIQQITYEVVQPKRPHLYIVTSDGQLKDFYESADQS